MQISTDALIEHARAAGIHVMVGAVDAENADSIAFHERLGFVEHLPGLVQLRPEQIDALIAAGRIDPQTAYLARRGPIPLSMDRAVVDALAGPAELDGEQLFYLGSEPDGIEYVRDDGVYVIALTLRYDRIDNFWFTLLHEFAHVALHLKGETDMIFDDLEIGSSDAIEAEADRFAQQALIPDDVWKRAHADLGLGELAHLADLAGVNPAIVAGRWQREFKDYRKFSKLVGHGCVRKVLL